MRSQWETGSSVYEVMIAYSDKRASSIYESFSANNYSLTPLDSYEGLNDILHYQSLHADEFVVVCGHLIDETMCIYRARHDEFYFDFSSTIDPKLSSDDFLEIIIFLDKLYGDITK